MSEDESLKPAVYDEDEPAAFRERGPWLWLVGATVLVATIIGFYQWRQRSRVVQITAEIETGYAMRVAPVAAHVGEFREKLEAWVTEVGGDTPESWADPRLDLSGLHRAAGLYLRLHADQTDDPQAIRDSALTMEPDSITRCLGLAPLSMRGFYERNEFLTDVWLDAAREADTPLRLRVFADEMATREERDMPLIVEMSESDYFLLVVQHGDNRREHPVDVYLWDLNSDQLLLKTRAQARGTLIPARIAIGGAPRGTAQPLPQRSAVGDCSIASQIRAVAGDVAASVSNAMPEGPLVERGAEEAADAAQRAAAREAALRAMDEGTPIEGTEAASEQAASGEAAEEVSDDTRSDAPAAAE